MPHAKLAATAIQWWNGKY